jgi:hypothetical protein
MSFWKGRKVVLSVLFYVKFFGCQWVIWNYILSLNRHCEHNTNILYKIKGFHVMKCWKWITTCIFIQWELHLFSSMVTSLFLKYKSVFWAMLWGLVLEGILEGSSISCFAGRDPYFNKSLWVLITCWLVSNITCGSSI